ncbi:hypothetical protein GGI1_08788, partial [Acidithiobacillus sp. GGI-221]
VAHYWCITIGLISILVHLLLPNRGDILENHH